MNRWKMMPRPKQGRSLVMGGCRLARDRRGSIVLALGEGKECYAGSN